MPKPVAFRPREILAALIRHDVAFILIGGLAATLHGAAYVTVDLDITPDMERANLDRLSAALRDLNARIRTTNEAADDGLEFDHDGESLARARVWSLATAAGQLDICVIPAGTTGYDDLRRDAVTIDLDGVMIAVASLADVVRSKEAAGRDKDRLALPMLRRLLEEQRRP
jgi:hypothetical protein